jgi:hypothetical protein
MFCISHTPFVSINVSPNYFLGLATSLKVNRKPQSIGWVLNRKHFGSMLSESLGGMPHNLKRTEDSAEYREANESRSQRIPR